MSTDGGAIRQLTNDFARDRAPAWAPDGRSIFFYSDREAGFHVWRIDADGGGLRKLAGQPGYLQGPIPSHDGSRFATLDSTVRQIYIYDARDWSKPLETRPPLPDPTVVYAYANDWSPDGRSLIVSAMGGRGGEWIYSLDSHTYRRIADGGDGKWLADGRRLLTSANDRLMLTEIASGATHEVLAIPGETVSSPITAVSDSQLFFLHGTTISDIWLMRFGDQK